ncbi:MAG: T9SS type A sorting domain-containing protein, partial [Bacteroidota bacterium]
WVGGSGDWFSESSWSPNGIPGAVDTARVTTSSPVLSRDTTVARFEFSGDSFDGDGNLTVTDAMEWSDGRMNGRGFAETAALTIAAGATMRISGDTDKGLRGRDIRNDGTVIWEGTGNLVVQWPTVIENRTDATFDIENDAQITRTNGTLDLLNDGLLVKSQATGTSSFVYPFGRLDNDGTIRVETGTLLLSNGSSFQTSGDGAFEVSDGAVLRFNSATYTYGASSTVSGPGTLRVTSGTTTLGSAAMTGLTQIQGGTLRLSNTDSASELAAVEVSDGGFGGEAEIDVNGLVTWTGGNLGIRNRNGTLNLLGGVEASGTDPKRFAGGTYLNPASFRWIEGPLEVNTGGTFRNLAGATFSIESDDEWTRSNGFITVVNEGTIVKAGTDGQTVISLPFAPFNNDGEIRVESGTLLLNITSSGGNSIDTGLYRVFENATLRFGGATRTFTTEASIEGTGAVQLGGTIRFSGALRPGASPGILAVNGDLPALQADGVLEIEIGGATPGTEVDQLEVSGAATLGGILRVTLTDGFTPQLGDRFQVISAAGGATGAFDQLELPDGLEAFVETSATGAELVIGTPVSTEPGEALPEVLALHRPAPNPTRSTSSMQVDLPEPARIRLALYDALGREVAVALDEDRPAGRHTVALAVGGLAMGVYVARLVAGGEVRTQRLTVVR